MNENQLKEHVKELVKKACELKNKYTEAKEAKVNYACIFSQNQKEYLELQVLAGKIGKIKMKTPTGPVYQIDLLTIAGRLQLLKIRVPDKTRFELGDADFTVSDYAVFKGKYLSKKGFRFIDREDYEMIELTDQKFDVRVYFSNPPLDEQLGL